MERGKLVKQGEGSGMQGGPAVDIQVRHPGAGGEREEEQQGMGAEHNNAVGCEGLTLADPSEGSEQSPEGEGVTRCHPESPAAAPAGLGPGSAGTAPGKRRGAGCESADGAARGSSCGLG